MPSFLIRAVATTFLASGLTLGSVAVAAPVTRAAAGNVEVSQYVMKKQALQDAHADAQAILSALQRDPELARQLADNPGSAEQLLRGRGATHADHIVVSPGDSGAARSITITITIDHVTIIIKL